MNVALKHFWLSGSWGRPPIHETVEVTDQVRSVDLVGSRATFIRIVTDSVRPIDQYARIASFVRSLYDLSRSSDRVEGLTTFIRLLYDVTKSSDRCESIASFVRTLIDSSKTIDLFERTGAFYRSLHDEAKAYDAYESILSLVMTLHDEAKTLDSVESVITFVRSLYDEARLSDTVESVSAFIRAFIDSFKAVDSLESLRGLVRSLYDVSRTSDSVESILTFVRSLYDVSRASDRLESVSSLVRVLYDVSKVFEYAEREVYAVPRPGPSYTLRYGLTYEQWADEKAKRIIRCLKKFYASNVPVDLQVMAEEIYRERLRGVSKLSWMPVHGRFTDFKPSAFIKNFLTYLVDKLVEDGYIMYGWLVEAYDKARVLDQIFGVSRVRIYGIGIRIKVVEVLDGVRVLDKGVEILPQEVKVIRYPLHVYVEIRDTIRASEISDGVETSAKPPETRITYSRRVLRIPPLDYLRDLCTWKRR
jgi:predicted metal-dependent HD superfamily phosphohydrolase